MWPKTQPFGKVNPRAKFYNYGFTMTTKDCCQKYFPSNLAFQSLGYE